MVQDAEAHKAEDEARKAVVELKNQADALIAQTEKSMKEMGDNLAADEKAKIEAAIKDLQDVLKDENSTKEQIEEKVKVLTEASHKMAEQMYKKEQGGEAGAADTAKKKDDDDVIDAEIE